MKSHPRQSKAKRAKRGAVVVVQDAPGPGQGSSLGAAPPPPPALPPSPDPSPGGRPSPAGVGAGAGAGAGDAGGGRPPSAAAGHAGMCCASDVHQAKAPRLSGAGGGGSYTADDSFGRLSLEIICHVLSYLPLRDVVRLESLSRRMRAAITLHLRLLRDIDFTEGEIYSWMCTGFTDSTFARFLRRCPDVVNIYGVHMRTVARRRQRASEHLSIPGIIAALPACASLYGVETSDIFLLEAITNYLPHIHILRTFRNRNGCFPLCQTNRFELHRNPRVTTLYLTGVVLPELPRMDFLQHLYLKWVRLTDPHPFRDFGVPLLRTFVMNNCAGPTNALKYVPLITGLAGARSLSRLELVRVPFLGGLIQHVVEDSWRMHGFRQLTKVIFGTCKHALEVDLGYLVITCAHRLEELAVQPSLTKDSLFASLTLADVDFPYFETLHLGYVDDFPEHGKWTNDQLVKQGLADINESPAMITDIGMRAVGQVFSQVKAMTVYNCPHLHLPMSWFAPVGPSWQRLKELHLRRCHAVRLNDFCRMIPLLPSLESLYLEQMFREPPKGCSRVGLSAGTGLGVSSALVQNSGNDAVNQDPVNNNPPVVPVNPMPIPPPPPGPPPAVPQLDHEHDGGDGDEDMEYSDSDYEAPPQGDPPFDQLLDPLAEGRHPMVDHVSGDLTAPRPAGMGMDMEDAGALEVQRLAGNQLAPLAGDAEPRPGTSRDRREDPASPVHSACQCSMSERRLAVAATALPPPAAAAAGNPAGVALPSRGRLKSSTRPCTGGSDAEDTSPTRRSKRLRLSRASPPPPSGGGGGSRTCSPEDRLLTGTSNSSSSSSSSSCSGSYTGKGKSLRGRKKGLVKRSAVAPDEGPAVRNRNQSCQAVSEEIRETTKKAKEDEAARRGSAGRVGGGEKRKEVEQEEPEEKPRSPLRVGHVSVGLSTCPLHSPSVDAATAPGMIVGLPTPVAAPTPSSTCLNGGGARTTSSAQPSQAPPSQAPGAYSDSAVASPSPPESEDGRSRRTMGTQTGGRGPQRTARDLRRPNLIRKPHMCDQATSTSDPVIEEDHIQMLEIRSSSLVSLTLRQVGVTDLIVAECPKLQMLAGTACRVLKYVTVKGAPQLGRVHFAQCRKLQHDMVIDQVCKQPPDRNRIIFLRPMQMYDPVVVERHVMASCDYNYNMCLVQDYCANPELTLYNRTRATSWLDIMFNINLELLKARGFVKADRKSNATQTFPWGRDIYKMQGESEGGYWWDLVTDMPWLRRLAAVQSTDPDKPLSEQDSKAGLYNPRTKSHGQTDVCLRILEDEICEAQERGVQLYSHSALVYVNMCDLYGPPVTDCYL